MSVFSFGEEKSLSYVLSSSKAGQTLIESVLVIALICLIFFGLFEVSQLFAHKEVLDYAAGRGARAKTVGFNQFMVFKTVRVGAIPNAGRLISPGYNGGPASEYAVETPLIPLYLGSRNAGELPAIMNYEEWDGSHDVTYASPVFLADGTLHMEVRQQVPLKYPFHRAFYADDSVDMTGQSRIDNHYELYIDDRGW